jgi:hypothetical protein
MPIDPVGLARYLAFRVWFVSVLTPPGQLPILYAPLCAECAPKTFSPEALQRAEQWRQQLLQGAGPSSGAGG